MSQHWKVGSFGCESDQYQTRYHWNDRLNVRCRFINDRQVILLERRNQ